MSWGGVSSPIHGRFTDRFAMVAGSINSHLVSGQFTLGRKNNAGADSHTQGLHINLRSGLSRKVLPPQATQYFSIFFRKVMSQLYQVYTSCNFRRRTSRWTPIPPGHCGKSCGCHLIHFLLLHWLRFWRGNGGYRLPELADYR